MGYFFVGIFYALFLQNSFGLIFRFFLIVFFISLAYFIVLPKKAINIFLWLNVIQAILIIALALYIAVFLTPKESLAIRFFFMDREWGDVYSYNGWFYKIQLKGNGLLPVAFFVTFFYECRYRIFIRGMLLIGCIFAGNFAFYIAISFFSLFYFLKSNNAEELMRKVIFLLTFIALFSYPVYEYYIKGVMEQKSEGSLGTRVDQVAILMSSLRETPGTMLFGQGLGKTIEKTTYSRDYRGNVYFELQAVYLLTQIGVLGFVLFICYHLRMVWVTYQYSFLILIYLSYVIYAITNPYIFDSTHIAVILLLNSLNNNEKSKNRSYNYPVQSALG
jgi:hypothetical protein